MDYSRYFEEYLNGKTEQKEVSKEELKGMRWDDWGNPVSEDEMAKKARSAGIRVVSTRLGGGSRSKTYKPRASRA